jgi:hypothetical protein
MYDSAPPPSQYEYVIKVPKIRNENKFKSRVLKDIQQLDGWCSNFKASTLMEMELFIPPPLVSKLSISVNGIHLPSKIKYMENSQNEYQWFLCSINIPRSLIQSMEKTRVTLEIQDASRVPSLDSYRGRCGSKRISIKKNATPYFR